MEMLITLHSHMRWLVLLTAVLAIAAVAASWLRQRSPNGFTLLLVRIYGLAVTLQLLLGVTQLAWRWNDFGDGLRHRLEHAVMMIVAVGLVHMTARWRTAPAAIAGRNTTIMLVGSLIVILLGIMILPQGRFLLGMG